MAQAGDTYGTQKSTRKHVRYSGFSSTLLDSFVLDAEFSDIGGTCDKNVSGDPLRVITTDNRPPSPPVIARHFVFGGFGPAIVDSLEALFLTEFGVHWQRAGTGGAQFYTATDDPNPVITNWEGFTNSQNAFIFPSFADPGDITFMVESSVWDLIVTRTGSSAQVFRYDGFSSTVVDSFVFGTAQIRGCYWDAPTEVLGDQNLVLSVDPSAGNEKVHTLDGFSNTILDSFAPGGLPDIRGLGVTSSLEVDKVNLGTLDDATSKWDEDSAAILFALSTGDDADVVWTAPNSVVNRGINAPGLDADVVFGASNSAITTLIVFYLLGFVRMFPALGGDDVEVFPALAGDQALVPSLGGDVEVKGDQKAQLLGSITLRPALTGDVEVINEQDR